MVYAPFFFKVMMERLLPRPAKDTWKEAQGFCEKLRASMVLENAFDILSYSWRIFNCRIKLHPQKEETLVVAATTCLNPSENQRLPDEAEQMAPVRNMEGNRASREACNVREVFCTFFNSPEGRNGVITWQKSFLQTQRNCTY